MWHGCVSGSPFSDYCYYWMLPGNSTKRGAPTASPSLLPTPSNPGLVALLGTPVVAKSHGTTTANLPRLFVLGKAKLLGRQGSFMPCPPRQLHPRGSPGCAAPPPWPQLHPFRPSWRNKAAPGWESRAPRAHPCWPQLQAAIIGSFICFSPHSAGILEAQPEGWDCQGMLLP